MLVSSATHLIYFRRNFANAFLRGTGGCGMAGEGRVLCERQYQGRGGIWSTLAPGSEETEQVGEQFDV